MSTLPSALARVGAPAITPARPLPGSPGRPLYHWHIPKTAGSAIERVLRDSFPVHAARQVPFVRDWSDDGWDGVAVISGHLGTFLPSVWPGELATFTILREPVERAWSLWRYLTWQPGDSSRLVREPPSRFTDLLDQPHTRWQVADGQANWLLGRPRADATDLIVPRRNARRPWASHRALAHRRLLAMDLVGVSERMDETIDGLSRLLGRRLSPASPINVNPERGEVPAVEAALLRRHNRLDTELWELANRRLDHALATLPRLPDEPLVDRPWELTMDAPLLGTGWHDRVTAPGVGWHRWTGPTERSVVWPDVRLAGRVEVEVEVVSAAADDLVRDLRVEVQGRPLDVELRPGSPGVVVHGTTWLDGAQVPRIELSVPRVVRLLEAGGGMSQPTALAVRAVRLRPQASAER